MGTKRQRPRGQRRPLAMQTVAALRRVAEQNRRLRNDNSALIAEVKRLRAQLDALTKATTKGAEKAMASA